MYASFKVVGRNVSVSLSSGWGPNPHIELFGATFPIVPARTVISEFCAEVPKGLHAAMFLCKLTEPRRMGSGKTAYLDTAPINTSSILLGWEEGEKVFMGADDKMTPTELSRFNPFVRSKEVVYVVDRDRKIAYVPDCFKLIMADPDWEYKTVTLNDLLAYITKQIDLAGLDERASVLKQRVDELEALRAEFDRLKQDAELQTRFNQSLTSLNETLARDVAQKEAAMKQAQERLGHVVTTLDNSNAFVAKVMLSRPLYRWLKWWPARIRPSMFMGFMNAIEFNDSLPK